MGEPASLPSLNPASFDVRVWLTVVYEKWCGQVMSGLTSVLQAKGCCGCHT